MGNRGGTSLIRTEEILSYISHAGSASFMDIVSNLNIPKSSALVLLNIMCEIGFLIKNESKQYSLGLKIYELGCQSIHKKDIFEITKRPMTELSYKSGLICHLGTIERNHAIYLDKIESSSSVPTRKSWIGKELELHVTALGKSLLAWKSASEIDYYINNCSLRCYTKNTIVNKIDFVKELELTKSRGWAIDREESAYNSVCISAPIFDIYHHVNYAISLSGNPNVFSQRNINSYVFLVKKYADNISRGLGYKKRFK
ncbi:IclR family transcriptional regulator [Vibrio tritonius]|uniref:IclR family transcriptional regulator n=1 Tax=Vibrio tritonius TaxID=1435069 RepID=UPI0008381928|nr:IclR family transcriptional regulator [Vibrio tritonius]